MTAPGPNGTALVIGEALVDVVHRGCGAPVRAAVVCAEGHEVPQRDVRAVPGVGAVKRPPTG